jgi:hypothetical protein
VFDEHLVRKFYGPFADLELNTDLPSPVWGNPDEMARGGRGSAFRRDCLLGLERIPVFVPEVGDGHLGHRRNQFSKRPRRVQLRRVECHHTHSLFPVAGVTELHCGQLPVSATSEGPPLPNSRNGSTTYLSGVRVTFTVTATQMIPTVSQKVNFTWAGTFCDGCLPGPINATLFNGAVQMSWFTNSSLSYLHITTKWPPII